MSKMNWEKVETLIDRILDLPEKERQPFIDQQCKGKPKLKGEVTLMLESIFDSEGWLENPQEYKRDMYDEMADDVKLLSSSQSLIDTQVGSYIIREKIGEGGMGSVYLAKHSGADINHKVAIKIIRSGKATKENIKRFKREQQILAGLNHPGIARMYDAGVTEDGAPYIIMEYVEGMPIDDYCKQQNCSLHHKIDLFNNVLQAVRYAHENLVIHRDLKPGNVLVDAEGHIKILDFGISKLLEDEEDPSLTQTGARVLTPRYAAPEQVRQENVITATDLYALGIIFYELLAGEHPFDLENLSQYEMEQAILTQEAAKPSSKVSDSKLNKQLQGDLDAIALKALRKEKDQRYRVANEFIEDLNNYKNGIPVSAVEDSFRYRSQKFYTRHKQGMAVTIGMLLLIIGLTGFYTWRIAQERDMAQLEAQKAANVSDFLVGVFESNYPEKNMGEEITARQLLQVGRKNASEVQDPAIKAKLMQVIGKAYFKIGFRDSALSILENSRSIIQNLYGKHSLEYAAISYDIGITYETYADLALPYFRDSFNISSDLLGVSDLKTERAMLQIGQSYLYLDQLDSAEYYISKSLENLNANNPSSDTLLLEAKDKMASLYIEKGELEKAEKNYLEIIQQINNSDNPDSLSLSELYQDVAWTYIPRKQFAKALPYLEQSLKMTQSIYGKGHSVTLRVRNDLAGVNRDLGNLKAFQDYSETNIKYTTDHYGIGHRITCMANAAYGSQLTMEKLYDKGEKFLRAGLKSCEKALGKKHIWTAVLGGTLAANLEFNGHLEKSNSYFQESYKILETNVEKFNRVNQRQIEIILSLYDKVQSTNQKRIDAYSKLIAPNK